MAGQWCPQARYDDPPEKPLGGIAIAGVGRLFFYESSASRDALTREGEGDPQASKRRTLRARRPASQ